MDVLGNEWRGEEGKGGEEGGDDVNGRSFVCFLFQPRDSYFFTT